MAKLADALDLGSSAARRVGSSPTFRTKEKVRSIRSDFFLLTGYANQGIKSGSRIYLTKATSIWNHCAT